ncbi:hypothetical protein APV28_3126 [Comamonas testosteroni]|nr:hypothetical protein APV28_3126 [Comamonas testosteroni]
MAAWLHGCMAACSAGSVMGGSISDEFELAEIKVSIGWQAGRLAGWLGQQEADHGKCREYMRDRLLGQPLVFGIGTICRRDAQS